MTGNGNEKRRYWLDRPANVDKIVYALYAICIVLLFGIDFFYHKHPHFSFESWHGFYAWYGLLGSVGLVLVAKLMRKVLMRDEDYYDR